MTDYQCENCRYAVSGREGSLTLQLLLDAHEDKTGHVMGVVG